MIKKLKPLSECENIYPRIMKDMYKYFGGYINVYKNENDDAHLYRGRDNMWNWHKDWFEYDVKILEDELFEVS